VLSPWRLSPGRSEIAVEINEGCLAAQFERFHRDAFIARITEFVERVGS
jgi:hypothetical protein